MKSTAEKSLRAAPRPSSASRASRDTAAQFENNRAEASTMQTLQALADTSARSQHLSGMQAMVNDSPHQLAQRKQARDAFGGTAQLMALEDEELMQGKFTSQAETAQLRAMEEEELMQGKFSDHAATAQLMALDDEELMQGKFSSQVATTQLQPEDEDELQGKFSDHAATAQLQGAEEKNRTGMPDNLKSGMENLSGMSLDDVQVHRNSAKPAALDALAYAQGSDIHLGPGQEKHLPHEAWHVVQQRQGRVKPTLQMAGHAVNDDISLETEADVMGAKALNQGSTMSKTQAAPEKIPTGHAVQMVKYPAYQTFTGSNGITYCSSTRFKSHAVGKQWVRGVLATLPGVSCNGKPRAVSAQPDDATIA